MVAARQEAEGHCTPGTGLWSDTLAPSPAQVFDSRTFKVRAQGSALCCGPYSHHGHGHEEQEAGVLQQVLVDPGKPGDVGVGLLQH